MSVTTKSCTAWWTELNGGICPEASQNRLGLPVGAHVCAHVDTYSEREQQVHPRCECRCGATHKKPVAQLLIDRHEAKQRQVSVVLGSDGGGQVRVGPADVSKFVSGGTVEFKAGHAATVTLGFPLAVMALSGGRGQVDEETAKALEALGWSGPNTELLRRRDLQDALGGGGAVLRDWETLISAVQMMAHRMEGLDK